MSWWCMHKKYRFWVMKGGVLGLLLTMCGGEAALAQSDAGPLKKWPAEVREVQIVNPNHKGVEPALFYAPPKEGGKRPVLVFLHQWGGDYLYAGGIPVARWCVAQNWVFVQPNFRGANRRPEALGSDLVISDICAALDYAREHADVDASRIYLLGASGGGHAALLAAGRMPGLFRAVSAWVPITDLVAWHGQTAQTKYAKYARDIENACGGALVPGSPAEKEAIARSPLTHLFQAKGTLFDLNAGIHDGHSHAVPISHTFRAYNLLARSEDQVS